MFKLLRCHDREWFNRRWAWPADAEDWGYIITHRTPSLNLPFIIQQGLIPTREFKMRNTSAVDENGRKIEKPSLGDGSLWLGITRVNHPQINDRFLKIPDKSCLLIISRKMIDDFKFEDWQEIKDRCRYGTTETALQITLPAEYVIGVLFPSIEEFSKFEQILQGSPVKFVGIWKSFPYEV